MSLHSVRDESGLISITDPEEVRNRWKQHFSAVFKTPVFTFCTDLLDKIPMYTTDENLAHAPSIDEVKRALKCMNLHKAAGKDRITADMLIYGGDLSSMHCIELCVKYGHLNLFLRIGLILLLFRSQKKVTYTYVTIGEVSLFSVYLARFSVGL